MEGKNIRRGGVLLHVTSLPGPEGIGTLGKGAYAWIDFLEKSGMTLWQVLPVGPTGYGESPYQSACALAGDSDMIDLALLHEEGWLKDYQPEEVPESDQVDFEAVRAVKERWLRQAFKENRQRLQRQKAFDSWCKRWPWLHDYALFMAIKQHFNRISWMEWPDEAIRMRVPEAMARYERLLREDIQYFEFLQFLFRSQWQRLHDYAKLHDVRIFGDMPIYVAEDSSDVWANAQYFQMDETRHPRRVAGVPPDYFSEDGQLWGNPLYHWSRLRQHGYAFWMNRLHGVSELYDCVRIDHFIGFANYYSIRAGEKTARRGHWVIGPGKAFFEQVKKKVPEADIIAEDLGAVNERVTDLLKFCGYPGMKVLQFSFDGGDENPHALHRFTENCVAYTGTHDNDTSLGWWHSRTAEQQDVVCRALGEVNDDTIVQRMIETVFSSKAATAVAPMQDILSLDTEARMNLPGTVGGSNWRYRLRGKLLTDELAERLLALNKKTGRA
jgi:4-alpha-glucanotransferase